MENEVATSLIVTTKSSFMNVDGNELLSVKAGVPVELAMEQAATLLDCIERVVLNGEALGKSTQTNCLQYLTNLARALVNASYEGLCEYERNLE